MVIVKLPRRMVAQNEISVGEHWFGVVLQEMGVR